MSIAAPVVRELRQRQVHVIGAGVLQHDVAAASRTRRWRTCPLRSGRGSRGGASGPSASTPSISITVVPTPSMLRAHLDEHVREVLDVGLARGVLDHGGAACEDGGHQDVLGRAHARDSPGRPPRRGGGRAARAFDVAVVDREAGAHALQALEVQVDAARTDVAAARAGHAGAARGGPGAARARRSTRASAAPARSGASVLADGGRVERSVSGSRPSHSTPAPRCSRTAAIVSAVRDPRHVVDDGHAVGQERRGHELQGRVLGAVDPHGAEEGAPAGDDEAIHAPILWEQVALGGRFALERRAPSHRDAVRSARSVRPRTAAFRGPRGGGMPAGGDGGACAGRPRRRTGGDRPVRRSHRLRARGAGVGGRDGDREDDRLASGTGASPAGGLPDHGLQADPNGDAARIRLPWRSGRAGPR